MPPLCLLFVAVALLVARPAVADPARDVRAAMHLHAARLAAVRASLADARGDARDELTCELAIRAARLANLPDSLELTSESFAPLSRSYRDRRGTHLKLADAMTLCDELRRWGLLVRAHAAVRDADRTASDDGVYADVIARTCRVRVDEALAAGFELASSLVLDNRTVRLGDARVVCDSLSLRRTAPYAALGVTGDRLQYLADTHGKTLYGVHAVELSTPRSRQRASIVFELAPCGDVWQLHRTELEGDRIVRESTMTFGKPPPPSMFR